MNQYPLWRYLLLITLIVIGIVYAVPNFYGEDPAIQISAQSGLPLTMQTVDQVKQALKDNHLSYRSITENKLNLLIRFTDINVQLKTQDLIKQVLGDNYTVALNLAPRTPTWLLAIGAEPMKLGLDLRGGVHFTLAVDTQAMLKTRSLTDLHSMTDVLRNADIRYSGEAAHAAKGITINFRSSAVRSQAMKLLSGQFGSDYLFNTVDSGNNDQLRGMLRENTLADIESNAIDQNMTILRNRVNALGVSEAVVQRQGLDRISVDLPGIQDTARAKDLIGKVATIRFQMVDEEHDPIAALNGTVPFGSRLYTYQGRPILLQNQIVLRGDAITSAQATIGDDGRPAVNIRLSGLQTLFAKMTSENIGKRMATVYVETKTSTQMVNGKPQIVQHQVETVISVATIQSALGNSFQITGLDSQRYAQNLALQLQSGAYSAPVTFIQERLVGPSLGAENIHIGILSTEIGSLAVIIFMLFYYRFFGVFADMALLLNIVFIVAVMSIIHATMSLPGIAGIVLTVGMAVDANVLINERIREELRNGMSPQASIYVGYERAFSTIVDANVTTLIVAVVLFALGSSSVKGFAVTLIIGLITSMVTSIFFTRALVNLIYGRRNIKSISIGIKNPVMK